MADRGGFPERPLPERVEPPQPPERESGREQPEPEREAGREVVEAIGRESEQPYGVPSPTLEPAALSAPPDSAAAYLPEVQRILSDGLYPTYAQLPPALQQKFKVEGERTARLIAKLLIEVRVKVGKIIRLIQRWLALIPGVNRYYLEQEAKLKADALLTIRTEHVDR